MAEWDLGRPPFVVNFLVAIVAIGLLMMTLFTWRVFLSKSVVSRSATKVCWQFQSSQLRRGFASNATFSREVIVPPNKTNHMRQRYAAFFYCLLKWWQPNASLQIIRECSGEVRINDFGTFVTRCLGDINHFKVWYIEIITSYILVIRFNHWLRWQTHWINHFIKPNDVTLQRNFPKTQGK